MVLSIQYFSQKSISFLLLSAIKDARANKPMHEIIIIRTEKYEKSCPILCSD